MPSLRTSLARARGLGSAKAGTETFWRQRLTSVLGLPLTIALVAIVLACIGVDHATATARVGHPLVATLLLLALLNFCVHMRIGMQIIIEDYVHNLFAKTICLFVNSAFAAAIGVASALAIVKITVAG
jgi:succinate dehydrogenase / fumarate reductase membrane anchor subunit